MSRVGSAGIWIIVTVLAVLHLLLHVGLSYERGAPDLFTLALLLATREVALSRAAGLGFALGLIEDSLSVLSFGANTVAMTLLGCVGALTRDLFVGDSRLFLASYLFIGKWSRDAAHWVASGWVESSAGLRQPFVEQVLIGGGIASAYVALVGMLVAIVTGFGREP
jgi:rod shape-determining protein MreD